MDLRCGFMRCALTLILFAVACDDDPVSPPASFDVAVEYCSLASRPVFFAYQDGGGAWQPVAPVTNGTVRTYGFNLVESRGGIVEVFLTSGRYHTTVLYASKAELTQHGTENCAATQSTKTVNGNVSGVGVGQTAFLSLGGPNLLFEGGISGNPVTFEEVPLGPVDFFGSRMATFGAIPNAIIMMRNQDIPNGGTLPAINFNAAGAVVPATANITIEGGNVGDEFQVYSDIITTNGLTLLWHDLQSNSTTRPWAGLPPSAMLAGDMHNPTVFASPSDGSGFRASTVIIGAVSNQTITLDPVISLPVVTQVIAGGYPRFRFAGALPAAYDKGATVDIFPDGDGNSYGIVATNAYLVAVGSGQAYDFTMPDIATLVSFPAAARLTAGPSTVSASGYHFTGAGVFDPVHASGTEFSVSVRNTSVIVP